VEDDQKAITMGVSDFAQKELGSIVYVDMPSPPHGVDAGDSVAAIECGDGVGEV
jgi:glycine cleavage system H lipoate-binding protein